jgi:hypothetical protein
MCYPEKNVHRATGGCGGEREGPDDVPEGARSPLVYALHMRSISRRMNASHCAT